MKNFISKTFNAYQKLDQDERVGVWLSVMAVVGVYLCYAYPVA